MWRNLSLKIAIVSFGCFLLIPLLYSENLLDPSLINRQLGLGIMLLFGLGFLLIRKKDEFQIKISEIFICYSALICLQTISLLYNGFTAQGIASYMFSLGLYLLFIVVNFSFNNTRNYLNPIVLSICLMAIVLNAVGWIQIVKILSDSGFSHQSTYSVTGLNAHRNIYAQHLLLCLPFTFVAAKILVRKQFKFAAY